jgi:hypothetical protein
MTVDELATEQMIARFFSTAKERYQIKLNKAAEYSPFWTEAGQPAWSADTIFQEWRFCNVFREDDKVTRWFRENIREKMETPVQHIRAAVAFRWFNLPATGELLLPWLLGDETMADAEHRIAARAESGQTILNAAYMIKSPPGMRKARGIFKCMAEVERALPAIADRLYEDTSMENAVEQLVQYPYLGPFMAYQAACDLRFTPVLEHAKDLNTWTAPGPGSARGIGRIFFGDADTYNYNSAKDKILLMCRMFYLLGASRSHWPAGWPKWELSTVQHWCCEFDKYCRVLFAEGEPKQRYNSRL